MNAFRWTQPLIVATLALLAGVAVHHSASAHTERCPSECGIKIEAGPWEYSGDKTITAVCIKAGTRVFSFTGDGTDGCYTVSGLGTSEVSVSGGASGSTCKDISHVVFYWNCNDPGGDGRSQ